MVTILSPILAGPGAPIGAHLRAWRQRRRSQLDLALDAEISQRHLSFVESGRAMPSRDMMLRLAEMLDVPLRERHTLLLAAGFAPFYAKRKLDDPALTAARGVIDTILRAHTPNPALAVDRHWHLVTANPAVAPLLAGVTEPALLRAPVNVLRLSLHPGALALRIANLPEWREHILDRLRRQVRQRRSGAGGPVGRTRRPRRPWIAEEPCNEPAGQRHRRAARTRHGTGPPVADLDHDGIRHADRGGPIGTGDRGILPGRRGHRRTAGQVASGTGQAVGRHGVTNAGASGFSLSREPGLAEHRRSSADMIPVVRVCAS